jgi:CHAT domain-containing protein
LYQRIIAPIKPLLAASGINTLIFCVGSQLRSTPLVGLHDGQQYLVEQYSLGLIPAFSLTDSRYQPISAPCDVACFPEGVAARNNQILAMGASQFEGLNPLPAVPLELSTITQPPWQGRRFLNQDFTLKNLRQQLQSNAYSIVHLATHASFNPGSPGNSYIQLWQRDRLLLSQIANLDWRTLPVELLVLSACQTAIGNPQAELGFAGLAYESGVKTALASLWSVGDLSTLALMREFYYHLADANVKTKAEALRRSQVALLRGQVKVENNNLIGSGGTLGLGTAQIQGQQTFTAPYHWAAFTLVGSPW